MIRTLVLSVAITSTAAKVIGFTLDLEPGPGTADEVALIHTMSTYQSLLAGTGLTLSADAGTAWVTADWNVTVNGTTRDLYQWLVDYTNETIIMDYDRNATNLIARAAPYLAYADERRAAGLPASVTVGVAIAPPGAPPPPTWWQTQSVAELEALIAAVAPALGAHPSFTHRYAVFTAESLFNASAAAPCPGCAFNEVKTLWYLADAWVYDPVAQAAFFDFAALQNVRQVYDAPHAGNRPHIGANPADEQLYRAFVRAADARGIDIQFFSGPNAFAYDFSFIKSC